MGDVLERVHASGLLPAGGRVIVLLSGGRDSVCLLDVACELLGGGVVGALHVNYGLREEAADDEAHCVALCERLGVTLTVHRTARPAGARGNLQAWARDVRYGVGAQLAAQHGALLAAGHTASDQAETVLYRLASSPGRRALLGMEPRRGLLVRPLLAVTRAQTTAWCEARGLAWREDSANTTDRFARGRVRGHLLPALRAVDARAEENVVRTAALLRDEAEVLEQVVDTALGGSDFIAVDRLAALPRALARLIVRRLAEQATGAPGARAAARLDDVLDLGDGALDVGDGARASVTGGILRFERTPARPDPGVPSLDT